MTLLSLSENIEPFFPVLLLFASFYYVICHIATWATLNSCCHFCFFQLWDFFPPRWCQEPIWKLTELEQGHTLRSPDLLSLLFSTEDKWVMDQAVVDNPVTLVIRAPNQKYDDQTINCYQNWTVEKLKAHLSDVYPSKPVSISPLFNQSCWCKRLTCVLIPSDHGNTFLLCFCYPNQLITVIEVGAAAAVIILLLYLFWWHTVIQ